MRRDFSENSKRNLLNLVSQVENEKWSDFTDWFGDRWYDFQSLIGKLRIRNYIDNVNEYHKKVIDKNNATKATIEKIFTEVNVVDVQYSGRLSSSKSTLQELQRYIHALNELVNPVNVRFNVNSMSDVLDGILNEISINELNACLNNYVEFDEVTEKYTYHWDNIKTLLSRPKEELTEAEYMTLVTVLSTMTNEAGYLDIENIQRFINLGYTTPSAVTSYDVHTSFIHSELAGHHSYLNYYYLQNKAYLNETFLTTVVLYDTIYQNGGSDNRSSNLNDLLRIIVDDYSVIEWRMKLDTNHFDTKRDFWSGEIYVKDDALAYFNDNCVPRINIQYCNDEATKEGLMYYLIYSNAYDNGVETASGELPYTITKDGIQHYDPTVKLYVNCRDESSADSLMIDLQSKSELSSFYQDYDLGSNIAKNIIEFAVGFLPGGDYINGAINLANTTETIEQITGSLKLIKKTDLEDLIEGSNLEISSKGEKVIDGGIDIVDKATGIYSDYKKVELNNEKVDVCKQAVDNLHNQIAELKNLGIRYNSVVIKYDEYDKSIYYDRDWSSYIENKKNSNSISEMDFMHYSFDRELLLTEYNNTKTNSGLPTVLGSSEEFLELEKQVKEYASTGQLSEGSYLSNYMKAW